MMTHHSVMTSSLLIKILKIDKFGDFSSDIDINTKMAIFRDVIFHIINQCDPRRPKGASGGHKVSASRRSASKRSALVVIMYRAHSIFKLITLTVLLICLGNHPLYFKIW